MRCSEASRLLQFYIDHQLKTHQIRHLETHLNGCIACQRELSALEELTYALRSITLVAEPHDLTANIMQRVAMSTQQQEKLPLSVLRLSLGELIAVIILASITTLGFIWGQPSLRAVLPFANGHDFLSMAFLNTLHTFLTTNISTLTFILWVGGTILGICITLVLAGSEMRSQWFKAMMDRLPVR